ncbi:F-box protein SKIP24-like [Camellia sinensis]|uniref:F-box protein SKIP24-like n=1 Tax=Camellia sinensis TaxID=4442 RepID=UPI0010362B99|nr:F-box protein SKIP24-like [Camellia sinensis]
MDVRSLIDSGTLVKKFEREKARKLAAHHRAVLRIESQIAEHSRKLQEIQLRSVEETEKMKATGAELSNLRKVRQASVALNVWQPEVVRGRHKQIVEQCVVPADSRIHALERELRLCKQLITGLDKAYRDEKRRLNAAKEQLASVKYHPVRDYSSTSGRVDECYIKRKKLKKEHIDCNTSC